MKIDPDLYEEEYKEDESAIRRLWNRIVRIFLVVLFATLCGVSLYFGVPELFDRVIEPIQENILAVEGLQDQIDALQSSDELSASQMRERLVSLEAELADQAETIANLQADLSSAEDDVEALTTQIEALTELADQVNDLSDALSEMTGEIDLLDESVTSIELPASALADRSQIVLSMILLTRARLWIEEDNLGLAAEDIDAAIDVLEAIEGQTDAMVETLDEILDRLDSALDDVRRVPQIAANELEIAWKLLTELAASQPETPDLEPTPTPTAEAQSE
jgi:chromosome segregation ATPase